ncbi:hypothetical protein AB0N09_17075 [Streptomyces erythrochromogenes]|uniref:hypothetical protein n=1 Tax=Streptomyces erythrochromogenes TaxID=285574 RepID=UPI00344AB348
MKPFTTGDRVSVLYLSKTRGTCLAMNRYVVQTSEHPVYGQKVWVEMPSDSARASFHVTPAHPDFINHMDADPISAQTTNTLIANLDWHLEMAAPQSTRPTWPAGWCSARVEVPLSEAERAAHAAQAALHLRELRLWRFEFARWEQSVTPEHLRGDL